jgi:hypothetical protein
MHVMSANEEANQKWLMYSKWSRHHKTQGYSDKGNMIQLNQCFANCNEEDEIYPLTVKEIVEAQKADSTLKQYFKSNAVLDNGLELLLVENESCICHKGRLVIPKPLQSRAVMWYHHYLQHSGHTHLEETMKVVIYWKGMRSTIRSKTKSCKTCQVNKNVHESMDICHLQLWSALHGRLFVSTSSAHTHLKVKTARR